MKAELLVGLASPQKEERKALLHGCAPGFKVVEDVLVKRLAVLQRQMLSDKNYESPNWAMLQADMVGQAKAYQAVIELLTLDREKE